MKQENETKDVVRILRENYGHQTEFWTDENYDDVSDIIKAVKQLLINTPQSEEFTDAIKAEMAHHYERWGDESKSYPHDFEMVISYLNGKLIKAIWDKDLEKAQHHLVTIAAVCGTAFKYSKSDSNTKKWFDEKGK